MSVGRYARPVASFVGMTFFWGYFRYQSFFEALFPPAAHGVLGGVAIQSHACVLLLLAVLVAVLAVAGRARAVATAPAFVVMSGALGTLGAAVALMVGGGRFDLGAIGLSGLCVAAGFVSSYLAWATGFSRSLGRGDIALLATSFFASILLSGFSRITSGAAGVIAVATPFISAFGWWASFGRAAKRGACADGAPSSRPMPPYIALFVVFLLVGAVVRGIVDLANPLAFSSTSLGLRWPISLVIAALVALSSIVVWNRKPWCVERFAMGMWVALAALFCAGVFWGLVHGTYRQGGQLVVVARSTLDFVFWILLCETAARSGGRAVSIFVRWGLGTEVVSWALSYIVVPGVFSIDAGGARPMQDLLVYASLFVLLIALIVLMGLPAMRRGLETHGSESAEAEASLAGDAGTPASPASWVWADSWGLSPREAQVAQLFSQGLSIKKISTMLAISPGTVQSHLKGAYRKLEVHSRDELIELASRMHERA